MTAERDPVDSVIVAGHGRWADLGLSWQALLDIGDPALELIVFDDAGPEDPP